MSEALKAEMLAALKGALVLIDSFIFVEEDSPKLAAVVQKRRAAIVAAIAKATDQSQHDRENAQSGVKGDASS